MRPVTLRPHRRRIDEATSAMLILVGILVGIVAVVAAFGWVAGR
jgi:hypothetical protein